MKKMFKTIKLIIIMIMVMAIVFVIEKKETKASEVVDTLLIESWNDAKNSVDYNIDLDLEYQNKTIVCTMAGIKYGFSDIGNEGLKLVQTNEEFINLDYKFMGAGFYEFWSVWYLPTTNLSLENATLRQTETLDSYGYSQFVHNMAINCYAMNTDNLDLNDIRIRNNNDNIQSFGLDMTNETNNFIDFFFGYNQNTTTARTITNNTGNGDDYADFISNYSYYDDFYKLSNQTSYKLILPGTNDTYSSLDSFKHSLNISFKTTIKNTPKQYIYDDRLRISDQHFKLVDEYGSGTLIPSTYTQSTNNSISIYINEDDEFFDDIGTSTLRFYLNFLGEARTTSTRIVVDKLSSSTLEFVENWSWFDFSSQDLLDHGWNTIQRDLEIPAEVWVDRTSNYNVYRINIIEKNLNNTFSLIQSYYVYVLRVDDNFSPIIQDEINTDELITSIVGDNVGGTISKVFNNIFKTLINGISMTFPISIIKEVVDQWNNADEYNLPNGLNKLRIFDENNNVYTYFPEEWGGGEDEKILVWGNDVYYTSETKDVIDLIRELSKYFMYFIFIMSIINMGKNTFKELTE